MTVKCVRKREKAEEGAVPLRVYGMIWYRCVVSTLLSLAFCLCCFQCDALLFEDECNRNGYESAYDPVTESCWIVERTPMKFDMAVIRCNHMPGYEGHLGFPKTTVQMNFIQTKFASFGQNGWIGLHHVGGTTTAAKKDRNEWYWTYPNGTLVNGSSAPWYPSLPQGLHECAYPINGGIQGIDCNLEPPGFFCEYERSTAHHETMLEHKCKQFPKWFWWEKSKSCILLDILNRRPAYAKLVCTHIPGYRGHLAHVNKVEKLASLDSFRDQVKNTEAWIGLERDANITTDTQDGFFWRRDDGYKVLLNQKEFPLAQRKYDNKNALFATLNTWYLQDDLYNTEFIAMCEYEEDLRYEPTMLDVNCASLSQTHIYYKGSCYVRDETKVTYDVAKKSCNHIDGFNGHLAVLNTEELLTIIYYAITKPLVANDYYWIGLERLDTSSANVSYGWYWLTGSGVNYPVTDFSAFKSGWPKADPCGYGWISNLASDLCTNTYAFLCEYVEPNKGTHFRIQANFANQKTAPQMILKVYDDLTHPEMCGYQCTKEITCMSIAFNENTRNCLLQTADSTVANTQLVYASGYKWYDRY